VSFYLGVWLAGFVSILLKGIWTDLEGPGFLDVDFVAVLTAYLFTQFNPRTAALFAFGQGLFLDLWSAGPGGLHASIYLLVLVGIAVGSRFFNMQEAKGQMTVVFSSVMLERAAFFVLMPLFGDVAFVPSRPWASLSSALVTGLLAPVIFHVMSTSKATVVGEG
jgi:rod shape-determining protein MreD